MSCARFQVAHERVIESQKGRRAALIVNADDYGMSRGVSEGIRVAHREGIVTSASAIMTTECATEELLAAREEAPSLAFGVHLSMSCGRPVLPPGKVRSLVSSDGSFLAAHAVRNVNLEELRQELRAQVEKFLETGVRLTHLNSHQCLLERDMAFFAEELDLADEFGVAVRWFPHIVFRHFSPPESQDGVRVLDAYEGLIKRKKLVHTDSVLYETRIAVDDIKRAVSSLSVGVHELMCHPGHVDRRLRECDTYIEAREHELRVLTDMNLKEYLAYSDVALADFTVLRVARSNPCRETGERTFCRHY